VTLCHVGKSKKLTLGIAQHGLFVGRRFNLLIRNEHVSIHLSESMCRGRFRDRKLASLDAEHSTCLNLEACSTGVYTPIVLPAYGAIRSIARGIDGSWCLWLLALFTDVERLVNPRDNLALSVYDINAVSGLKFVAA